MKFSIEDKQTKEMLTEIIIDIIKNKKDLFYELIQKP